MEVGINGINLDLSRHTLNSNEAFFVVQKACEFLDDPCGVLSTWEIIAYTACLLEANTRHIDMDSKEQAEALMKRTRVDAAMSLLPEVPFKKAEAMKKADEFVRRAMKIGGK